ncbi:rab3 GTPase-activating protein non-catalytic subunit-like isoform X2 [Tubulanus polymorphus]|uniref:rab3 GTPase-activating protein non-catalytic subunit-like isoform X2 n=1 Tax=Tubulanus polymorphus TaxID=672921 RepID=UPI003DA31388
MACQLSIIANFHDITNVRNYLFPHLKSENQVDDDSGGWGDDLDWGWQVDDETTEQQENADLASSWLQNCLVSVSPMLDNVAIAYDKKIVILSQKWDSDDDVSKFVVTTESVLGEEDGEIISSIICLPLSSQKRSSQGAADWTCFIIGFSTGYVRMYTENGTLLISQLLHEEPVVKLKSRSYAPARYTGDSEQHEELTILYPHALVSIDGFSLFQTLRACRNQVARAAASGSDSIQPPPLAYRKFGLQEQDFITDQVSVGIVNPNPFDQMKAASLLGGFSASIKPTPPVASQYITAGIGPYVGFFYAVEGSAQPLLSDVALAVANKLKSAIFTAASGWFGIGGKNNSEDEKRKKPKVEPATPLPIRFGLPDKRRQGESIQLSPNNKLAVTTDSYGRIVLIDVDKGIAIRMWKGYRDAQVAWVEVKEDSSRSKKVVRTALFLIIYAPRRGILEVWTAQQGMRVSAFNVGKWCTLTYPGFGMMGLNNVTYREGKGQVFQCCLLDVDGTIKVVDVPFHLALSDKNSKRARDMHLLKKLKLSLRENKEESDLLESEILAIFSEMRTAGMKIQGLERVLSTKYLSSQFMDTVIQAILQHYHIQAEKAKEEAATLDTETKRLIKYCQLQQQLIHTYCALEKVNSQKAETGQILDPTQILVKILGLNEADANNCLDQLNIAKKIFTEPRVRFASDVLLNLAAFLGCFECHTLHLEEHAQTGVSLKPGLPEDKLLALGNFVFKTSLNGTSLVEDLITLLQVSILPPDDLVSLLFQVWLNEERLDVNSLPQMYKLLKIITKMKDITVDSITISPWWQQLRLKCSQTTNIASSLLASIVSRFVSSELFSTKDKDAISVTSNDSSKMDMNEWESVSIDIEQWNILVKQLEDVLALSCLLQSTCEPTDGQVTVTSESLRVSVARLLEGGKGVFAELVSRWIVKRCLPISVISQKQVMDSRETSMETEDVGGDIPAVEEPVHTRKSNVENLMNRLTERLGQSLNSDVLTANCSWEHVVQWNKDPEMMDHLKNSLDFLQCVQNAALKHGICIMMWNTFIAKKWSALAQLIEKVGKVPKDRLCRRDVGMSDKSISSFAQLVCDLLDILMQANCDIEDVGVYNIEELWQEITGPTSLVQLAIDQPMTNYGLIRHHYLLAVCVYAVLDFSMKSIKVLSLFDTRGKSCFFKDLNSYPLLPAKNIDIGVIKYRQQFFHRIIGGAVQYLSETVTENSESEFTTCTKYTKWPPLILSITQEMGVDVDEIKRQHVCELYSYGFDKLGEEVLLTVNDHAVMGSQLILIAGQRLSHYIIQSDPEGGIQHLSKLSTTLSTWLKSLDSTQLKFPNVAIKDTATLIGQVVNQLAEGHNEYQLAISLVDLVQKFL